MANNMISKEEFDQVYKKQYYEAQRRRLKEDLAFLEEYFLNKIDKLEHD